jgi:prepilin-type N-terminal cleavage/methylation domain-containing protein
MSRISANRHRARRGFTLLELMIATAISSVVFIGILSAYLFVGRNLTRLVNLQQQEVASRGTLHRFTQDVGTAGQIMTSEASQLVLLTATVTLSGGGATMPATATANFDMSPLSPTYGLLVSFNITSGGAGYTSAPTVTITGYGGSGGTATATVASGSVTALTLVSRGATRVTYTYTPPVVGPPLVPGYLTRTDTVGSQIVLRDLTAFAFAYYNEGGTAVTSSPQSVKAIEVSFSSAVGSAASGTLASYSTASARILLRNKALLQ